MTNVLVFKSDARISPEQRNELRAFASVAGQNVKALAKRLGVTVGEEYLPDEISAVLLYSPQSGSSSGYRIAVNSKHSAERQRWSIAHELGHFLLHRDDPNFRVVDDRTQYGEVLTLSARIGDSFRRFGAENAYEREADRFVADLLMPPFLIKRSIGYRLNQPALVAREFYVSCEAAANRINQLRVV